MQMTLLRFLFLFVFPLINVGCYEAVPEEGFGSPDRGSDQARGHDDSDAGTNEGGTLRFDTSVDLTRTINGLDPERDLGPGVDSSIVDGSDVGTETSEPVEDPPPVHFEEPVLYSADSVHSPITGYVASTLREIAASNWDLADNVFMKVGASGTVSTNLLYCFADGVVDLDGRDHLQPALDYFLEGNGNDDGQDGDQTPFDRPTYAAKVGRTAKWAITGSPSPLELEIAAIRPRFALINYGTNDMQMGTTYASALWGFYESYMTLLDQSESEGIIPILVGLNPRSDSVSADRWIPTYNAVVRGMAQDRQIPFLDLHLAVDSLAGGGLSSDGLHANVYYDGGSRACVFDEQGLQYGYNVRNLLTLEALDRVKSTVIDGVPAIDEGGSFLVGDGSPSTPFEIPELPFAHGADTTQSAHRNMDLYTGCSSDSDESGPEYVYSFELEESTAIRALVLDREGVDIDIHLLGDGGVEDDCIRRAHHLIQGELSPGRYFFSLDTWVNSSRQELGGDYLFVILRCDRDDSDCNQELF